MAENGEFFYENSVIFPIFQGWPGCFMDEQHVIVVDTLSRR